MAIYFKFKSEKFYNSISVNEPFTSVASFKRKVYELRYKGKKNAGLCLGNDFDIRVINAQTNECYDDGLLIPNHTSVLIQRVPGGRRCKFIDTTTIVVPGSHIPKSSASNSSTNNTSSASSSVSTSDSGNSPADAFQKSTEGITSKRFNNFPVELLCLLCKKPMKDASFTSKCCLSSFCDKCIRDHLMVSNFICVCGETNMLTDYLIPNITVRRLIDGMLQSGFIIPQTQTSTSTSTSATILAVHPQTSACDRDRVAQPQTSVSANDLIAQPQTSILASKSASTTTSIVAMHPQTSSADDCDHDRVAQPRKSASANVLMPLPQTSKSSNIQVAEEEAVQRKLVADEAGKKKRKREDSQNVATESYLLRTGFNPYNSFGMDFNGYIPRASFGV